MNIGGGREVATTDFLVWGWLVKTSEGWLSLMGTVGIHHFKLHGITAF